MHLGEEERWTKWLIIVPFTIFILYLIFMMTIGEGDFQKTRRIDGPIETDVSAKHSDHK